MVSSPLLKWCEMTYGNYENFGVPGPYEVRHVHVHRQEGPVFQDSVEIGTPSKGGALKVYFNAADPEDAKSRVQNAFLVRDYAASLVDRVNVKTAASA